MEFFEFTESDGDRFLIAQNQIATVVEFSGLARIYDVEGDEHRLRDSFDEVRMKLKGITPDAVQEPQDEQKPLHYPPWRYERWSDKEPAKQDRSKRTFTMADFATARERVLTLIKEGATREKKDVSRSMFVAEIIAIGFTAELSKLLDEREKAN